MVFHWSLSDKRSSQVFRILLRILADINRAVVRWSPLKLFFPLPPDLLPILLWLYWAHWLQLLLPSLLCSIDFSVLKQGASTYFSFRFLSILICGLLRRQSPQFRGSLFFLLTNARSGHLARIRWFLASVSHQRKLMVFHWSLSEQSLPKSPGLFSVFWPISTMLSFGYSLLVLRFLTPPAPFPRLWGLFQAH